jgi:hypothetical protein
MKKSIILLWLVACCLWPAGLLAQNMTTFSAANIMDATGAKLATGKLYLQATDQNGTPISYQCGGGGQVVRTPHSTAITTGAIISFSVCNPANTLPAGIFYHIWAVDLTTASATYGQSVLNYGQVQWNGGTFNLDAYTPAGNTSPPSGYSVTGNMGINGNLNVTGYIGSLGIGGPVGPAGPTGPTGPTGPPGAVTGGLGDPGANGLLKRTGLNVTAAAAAGTDYVIPSGTVAHATALAGTPTQCSGGQFALGIGTSGNATCATPVGAVAADLSNLANPTAITLSTLKFSNYGGLTTLGVDAPMTFLTNGFGNVGFGTASPAWAYHFFNPIQNSDVVTQRNDDTWEALFAAQPKAAASTGTPIWGFGLKSGMADATIFSYDGVTDNIGMNFDLSGTSTLVGINTGTVLLGVSVSMASTTATATYTSYRGPLPFIGQTIFLEGFSNAGNNGPFTLTGANSGAKTVTYTNASGITEGGSVGDGTGTNPPLYNLDVRGSLGVSGPVTLSSATLPIMTIVERANLCAGTAAGSDCFDTDNTLHGFGGVHNGDTFALYERVIASGSGQDLGVTSVTHNTCNTITVAAVGAAATDRVSFTPNASIKAVTGYTPAGTLTIVAYPSAGYVNFDVCNKDQTNDVTPGHVYLNWAVVR